jgi:hypothetical protein
VLRCSNNARNGGRRERFLPNYPDIKAEIIIDNGVICYTEKTG